MEINVNDKNLKQEVLESNTSLIRAYSGEDDGRF